MHSRPSNDSREPLRLVTTAAELLELARSQGLELTPDRAELDGSGLDFLVLHARDGEGTPWIVRTPRRADVYEGARVEAEVLRFLAPRMPVRIPDWRIFAPGIIAYPRLEGTPAVTIDTSQGPTWNLVDPKAPSDAFVDSMAETFAALHAISERDAEGTAIRVTPVRDARWKWFVTMKETRNALKPPEAVWARWQAWIDDDSFWPEHVVFTHGDLHPGHMLLDEAARLIGVLDFTEAQITDPSVDFAMFFGCFGEEATERFVARFAARGGRTWPKMIEHAKERWCAGPAAGAEWALRTGNDAVLEQVRAQLAASS